MTAEDGGSDPRDDFKPERKDRTSDGYSAKSVLQGLRDTASHMLAEARAGASRAQEEAWERYEAKTKHRRKQD